MSATAKENNPNPKTKAAKAPIVAGERKKRQQAVSEADAKKAFAALEKGGTTLIAESKKLGFSHNGPLRAALRNLIGDAKYNKLMEGTKKVAVGTKPPAAKTAAAKPAAKKSAAKKAAPTTPATASASETPAEVASA